MYDPSLDKFYADAELTQLLATRATNSLIE
jgi:hypothetical protein